MKISNKNIMLLQQMGFNKALLSVEMDRFIQSVSNGTEQEFMRFVVSSLKPTRLISFDWKPGDKAYRTLISKLYWKPLIDHDVPLYIHHVCSSDSPPINLDAYFCKWFESRMGPAQPRSTINEWTPGSQAMAYTRNQGVSKSRVTALDPLYRELVAARQQGGLLLDHDWLFVQFIESWQ